jgi:hypothetical protein
MLYEVSAIRTLDERPSIRDNPIFSSERMLHKDYDRKDSIGEKNLRREIASRQVTVDYDFLLRSYSQIS